jgi:hypothetical protein
MPLIAAATPPYGIELRDPARQRVGQVDRLTSLELTPTFNGVGGWSLTLPAGTSQADAFAQGGWITLFSGDRQIFAGQVRGLKLARSESDPFAGTLTAYGPSAEVLLTDRLAYQVPGQPATLQGATEYDKRTGPAETVIKQYVNLNAGPGAIAARRTAGLIIEADGARGGSVTGSARMTPLLDLIGPLAETAGLGFRVVLTTGNQFQFQVFTPTDKTASARFGIDLGNLTSFERQVEAPKVSAAIVGGSGEGLFRAYREVVDDDAIAAWGNRVESFVDSSGDSDAELDQAGVEQLTQNGPSTGITIQTIDTPNLRFARDYYLGDRVTAEGVADVLRGVTITWSASEGATTTSTVGTASVTGTKRMIQRLKALTAQVAALQANK